MPDRRTLNVVGEGLVPLADRVGATAGRRWDLRTRPLVLEDEIFIAPRVLHRNKIQILRLQRGCVLAQVRPLETPRQALDVGNAEIVRVVGSISVEYPVKVGADFGVVV